ncbi:MAG TPA: hypothetical protein VGW40_12935 [Allosphingosinicella sp.]|nr:hypothetical protein [Allosphingosinicella sp.]
MAEIWLGGARVAERNYNRHPEKGDIIELAVGGDPPRDFVVERKAVYYDRQGGMTERIYVAPAP